MIEKVEIVYQEVEVPDKETEEKLRKSEIKVRELETEIRKIRSTIKKLERKNDENMEGDERIEEMKIFLDEGVQTEWEISLPPPSVSSHLNNTNDEEIEEIPNSAKNEKVRRLVSVQLLYLSWKSVFCRKKKCNYYKN